MYCLTVTYPKSAGSFFDYDYYVEKHIPLCAEAFAAHGFMGTVLRLDQGAAPGATDLSHASIDILFNGLDNLKAALKAGGKVVSEDLGNYTDVKPVMVFSGAEVNLLDHVLVPDLPHI